MVLDDCMSRTEHSSCKWPVHCRVVKAVGTFRLPFCCSSADPSELDSSLVLLACSAAAAASSAAAFSSASACSDQSTQFSLHQCLPISDSMYLSPTTALKD